MFLATETKCSWQEVSSRVCVGENRWFKPEHHHFLTLTKWFSCPLTPEAREFPMFSTCNHMLRHRFSWASHRHLYRFPIGIYTGATTAFSGEFSLTWINAKDRGCCLLYRLKSPLGKYDFTWVFACIPLGFTCNTIVFACIPIEITISCGNWHWLHIYHANVHSTFHSSKAHLFHIFHTWFYRVYTLHFPCAKSHGHIINVFFYSIVTRLT